MRKFLAVVKREYLKLVWSKAFAIGTLLAPLMAIGFTIVPALIFTIEGEATRVAIVDQSGQLATSVNAALLTSGRREQNSKDTLQNLNESQTGKMQQTGDQMNARFLVEEINIEGKSPEQIKSELNERLRKGALDVYVVIPKDFENEEYGLFTRNTSDFVAQSRIERALNEAVREARMAQANISREKLDAINREVKLKAVGVSESGEREDSGESFILLFIVGFMIYIVLTIYGQQVLAAVVEEKETRIAEILFSSARPFTLMMGKLVGVGLVALTQLAIWVLSAAAVGIYSATQIQQSGGISLPSLSPVFVLALFVFFLLGFFLYATIYALIGSMVTTVQEGGQFAFPPMLLLIIGFYCAFPVIRSPNSEFAVWISLVPFFSPIVMPVRMAIQMPPLWQIMLAILISLATIVCLIWIAARAYRIGMLMTGKKATIPEVWRWIWQP